MENDLSDYRRSYNKGELLLEQAPEAPLELFKNWFYEVDKHFPEVENNAMTLATIGSDGFPKSRIVLLKKFTDEGFVFFTNYNSEKGKALETNPNVCLSFFWHDAERQVLIKGSASKISKTESDSYFQSRPKGSQLGALASNQSEIIPDRAYLEHTLKTLEETYKDKPVKRPEHWGGYIVRPVEVEFWQGRPNRLHDRIRYAKLNTGDWTKDRLSP